jgi:AraC-like DNA-binding protein
MQTLFFQSPNGTQRCDEDRSGLGGIRLDALMPGLVMIDMQPGRGMAWKRRVENFDRMVVMMELLSGNVTIRSGGKTVCFETGDSVIFTAAVGSFEIVLDRRMGADVQLLFLSDFFLKAYGGGANDFFVKLYEAIGADGGLTVIERRKGVARPIMTQTGEIEPMAIERLQNVLKWLAWRLRWWGQDEPVRERVLVERATQVMESALPKVLTLESLAMRCGVGVGVLKRAFWKITGEAPGRYLRRKRLQKAKMLLASGCTVAEAGKRCGFLHGGHFSRLFRQQFGVTPGQWHH